MKNIVKSKAIRKITFADIYQFVITLTHTHTYARTHTHTQANANPVFLCDIVIAVMVCPQVYCYGVRHRFRCVFGLED